MDTPVFNSFWHGDQLTALEWACLQSFLSKGFRVRLFVYAGASVPAGVELEDAESILSRKSLFLFENSFATFSDIFRYRLLLRFGGWWVDTDVLCLSERVPDCETAWAPQDRLGLNGAVLRFPAADPRCAAVLAEAEQLFAKMEGHSWGDMGPQLLTRQLPAQPGGRHFGTREAFYPVHWLEFFHMWFPEFAPALARQIEGATFLHVWRSMFARLGVPLDVAPPTGSFLETLYRAVPAAGAMPPLTQSEHAAIRRRIRAWAVRPWYDQACAHRLGVTGRAGWVATLLERDADR